MRLLYYNHGELCLTKDLSNNIPPYAILSHRWGQDEDEVKFRELNSPDKNKAGYRKLQLCGKQTSKDELDYFWVDTCCIDKSSSAELDKNINSMFRYYRESTKCYVYLSDVESDTDFEQSEWFSRGWTLQELLAPQCVEFYSQKWHYLGNKADLQHRICNVTQIPVIALHGDLSQFTKDERLRWIRNRETTEKEDKAYCLVGIFNVSMSLHYGEGEQQAFARLENKIKKSLKPTLQTVDNSIRNYYLDAGRLNIERLSGQQLPMGSCFINLSIVDNLENERSLTDPAADGLSLTTRLRVKTPVQSKQVTLGRLFDRQKLAYGRHSAPKHVLIWGRAGIGKTTLCKKMVHEFYYNDLWQDLYDRVFWLPLRRLKWLRDEVKSVAELVEKVCFHSAQDGFFPLEQLQDMLNSKCLFLLDGLDEVSSAFDPDSSMAANLNKLLSQENVIITSRPHSTNILDRIPPDLRLETIGFFPAQVEEYLQKSADLSQSQVSQVRAFLKGRPVLQSLVRIPIQLDAVCYTWSMAQFQQDSTTMTELYQATSDCLWKKDIVRLGMKFEGEPVTPQQIQICTDVRVLVEQEAACLEKLAFGGLYHQVVEFNLTNVNSTAKRPHPHFVDRICKSSFLRSSDELIGSVRQSYHFIHLTFQEFFAARYFVDCFSLAKIMNFPVMVSMDGRVSRSVQIQPAAFIEKEKYNAHFNVFWRFVAGLLSREGDEYLDGFFRKLESEPIDLLGVLHQRLMAHCLNEVGANQAIFSRKARELTHDYTVWTQLELRLFNTQWLLEEAECPVEVLKHWLMGTDTERSVVMESLMKTPNVSPVILGIILEQVENDSQGVLRDNALAVIAKHCDQLADDFLTSTFMGQDKQGWLQAVKRADVLKLAGGHGLYFVQSAACLLQDEDNHCQDLAMYVLERQPDGLPKYIVDILIRVFMNQDSPVRWRAVDTLVGQKDLPESVVASLVELLEHQDHNVRRQAIDALTWRRNLSESVVTNLVQLLEDHDLNIGWQAADALRWQENLSGSIITKIARLLEDQNSNVRFMAVSALRCQESLPESVVTILAHFLEDQTAHVRNRAALALGRQKSLSESVVTRLVALLKDQNTEVRGSAAEALERHGSLPGFAVTSLAQLLENQSPYGRWWAIKALAQQGSLPDSVVTKLIQLLQDPDPLVRWDFANALTQQLQLSELHCRSIADLLEQETLAPMAIRVLESHANCAQLIVRLNYTSLQNVMRIWLERSFSPEPRSLYCVLTLHGGNLVVEFNVKRWTVALEDEDQKVFKERWYHVQRALGIPGVPLKNARVLRKRKRD